METNGFDGARKTTSAPAIASRTPERVARPPPLVADGGHLARCRRATNQVWKSSSPAGVVRNVRTGSSDAGRAGRRPELSASRRVASESGTPSRSSRADEVEADVAARA